MKSNIEQIKSNLENSFFGFWVKNYKFSFLLIILIVILGLYSLFTIPKESDPDIDIGVVTINTIYEGATPGDVYDLITKEIEDSLEDINGINNINGTSRQGISSVTVEMNQGADRQVVFNKIKDEVDKLNLPENAEKPSYERQGPGQSNMYNVLLYSKNGTYSPIQLKKIAEDIKNSIEGDYGVSNIDIEGGSDFEYNFVLNGNKIHTLGLTLNSIGEKIANFNRNIPLGNNRVGDLEYDFILEGEYEKVGNILDTVISGNGNSTIKLEDVLKYRNLSDEDNSIKKIGFIGDRSDNSYVKMSFEKEPNTSIFQAARQSKEQIKNIKNNISYEDLGYVFTNDVAKNIKKDYKDLAESGLQTILLVFLIVFLFVGVRQALLATFSLPLAFLVTFVVLNQLGFSLNFLTNFSFILTLGIAIDTIIVIIEGASAKKKIGYTPKHAILLAIKELKAPLIAGTLTTLVAFLPMMMLPGVIGQFLAFIPITVFSTLLAALIISLTLNIPIFAKFTRNQEKYNEDKGLEKFLSEEDKLILESDRKEKIQIQEKGENKYFEKIFNYIQDGYQYLLYKFLKNTFTRICTFLIPIILLVLSFIFLSSKIGFTLFPSSDNSFLSFELEYQKGIPNEELQKYTKKFDVLFNSVKEIDNYYYNINNNTISISFNLIDKSVREENDMKTVFEVQDVLSNKFEEFKSRGFNVSSEIRSGGPPQGAPVGIRLIAEDVTLLSKLRDTAKDFQSFLREKKGIKSTSISSQDTPGQFRLDYKYERIAQLGLQPSLISNHIRTNIDGYNAGTLKNSKGEYDILIKNSKFNDKVSVDDVKNISIPSGNSDVYAGEVVDISLQSAVDSINTRNGDIYVSVNGNLFKEYEQRSADIQSQLGEFANSYNFTSGISFQQSGEQQENRELIISTAVGFFITLLLIFSILVLQLGSYGQPIIVLYSIILATLGVNIGLYLTSNPYSMPFAIGFLALTGIVVNNAIILIDRINSNFKNSDNSYDKKEIIVQSGRSRLRPILLTSLTTIFGILPISFQDAFWSALGFTLISGLIAGGFMTLLVTPCIYYEFFVKERKGFFRSIFSWFLKFFRKT